MKKILFTAFILVTVFALVFSFASCKGSEADPDESVANVENHPAKKVNGGYSAELTEGSLKIYKDDVFVQELIIPENKKSALVMDFAKNHIDFKDLNFDGNEDVCLSLVSTIDGFVYCCWIYDAEKNEFVYNETISALSAITIDADKKQIVSTEKNADGETIYVIYEWSGNDFKRCDEKSELPETAAGSVLGTGNSNATVSRKPVTSTESNEQAEMNDNTVTEKEENNNSSNETTGVQNPETTEAHKPSKPSGSSGIQYGGEDLYGQEWY